jgi:shikimate kinase
MKSSIVLTGLSGSGKTSVGMALSELLSCQFLDTDSLIESRHKQSVSSIFASKGEQFFRDAETEVLEQLVAGAFSEYTAPLVISTGGGIVIREQNRRLLKALGKVIFLSAPIQLLSLRLSNDMTRPLLSNAHPDAQDDKIKKTDESAAVANKLSALWLERKTAYLEADLTVETSDFSPAEVAKTISSLLEIKPPICKIQSEC